MARASQTADETPSASPSDKPICGVIRPIADLGDYLASHWLEVHAIIADAVDQSGYRARLVSESDASGVILSEIVTNLYENPIVVCDVSGRNPNVMFELGMRLAFEKPTIVIKDDETPFSFDTSPVKHLMYPRSLRFQAIVDFKLELSRALISTVEASQKPDHRGYLQQFGPISVTQLGEQSLDLNSLAEELRDTRRMMQSFRPTLSSWDTFVAKRNVTGGLFFIMMCDAHASMLPSIIKRVSRILGTYETIETHDIIADEGRSIVVEVGYRGGKLAMTDFIEALKRDLSIIPGVQAVMFSLTKPT